MVIAGSGARANSVSVAVPGALSGPVRLILAYESNVRGRSIGQACYELVMEAADVDSYPEEVRARIDELEEASAQAAVAKTLRRR